MEVALLKYHEREEYYVVQNRETVARGLTYADARDLVMTLLQTNPTAHTVAAPESV